MLRLLLCLFVCLFFLLYLRVSTPYIARLTCVGPPGRLLCYFMNATLVI